MDATSPPPLDEQRLRQAGLKATRSRLAVLRAFAGLGGHPRAVDIVTAIASSGTAVSRATVFNALNDLAAAGLLMRVDTGSGATRYEMATRSHHHFVCKACGEVADVPCGGPAPCHSPDYVDGLVDDAQIVYRGTCSSCAERI